MFALVPTGGPVLAELGHPDVTTDDTDSSGGFCRLGRGALSRRFVGVHGSFVCTPCLANWGGGGLSRLSVLRGSLHPHATSHRVSECNPSESLA